MQKKTNKQTKSDAIVNKKKQKPKTKTVDILSLFLFTKSFWFEA